MNVIYDYLDAVDKTDDDSVIKKIRLMGSSFKVDPFGRPVISSDGAIYAICEFMMPISRYVRLSRENRIGLSIDDDGLYKVTVT
jgi:hypothetical protein